MEPKGDKPKREPGTRTDGTQKPRVVLRVPPQPEVHPPFPPRLVIPEDARHPKFSEWWPG